MNMHQEYEKTEMNIGPAAPKVWQAPLIVDADIGDLTAGGGTSGIEGTSFLKIGS